MRSFARAHPDAFFIEIGANDGVQGDHVRPFLRSGSWSGVMVEPLPRAFERLRANYAGNERVALEKVAIASSEGRRTLYEVDPASGEWHDWYDSIASFDREAVLHHAPWIPGLEERIVATDVECIRFETLCARHSVGRLDLLIVDTEGHDREVVSQVDLEAMRPRLLVYEHAVMSPEDRAATRAEVEAAGYETLEEGNDTWCLDTGPDDRLSREWPGLRPGAPAYSIHDQPAGSAR